jgi:hypothetical protein
MMNTEKRIAVTALIALTFGPLTSVQAQTAAPATIYDNNNVRRVVVLDKMRGHLAASIIDWDMAQYDMAMHHSDEIPTELYSIVANDLKAAKLQDSFLAAANSYAQLSMQAGDKTKVHAAYDALIAVIADARSVFAPAAAFNDVGFRLKVAQGLLSGVAEEYSEGVSGGQMVKLIGYQNAVGFLKIAQENYSAVQKTIQAQYPDLDKTVSAQYTILAQAMTPDLITPVKPADPQTLSNAIDTIQKAEEQALGMPMVTARSVPEVLAAARAGLNDALDEYTAGNADNAYDLAASAYLDNYESLEVPLRAKNATLTDLIESQFNQFDKLIKSGAKIDDLKALYTQIATNLDQAQALLAG